MVSISYPETKDQWARDDPAFLVLLSIWLCGKLPFVATIPVTSNCSLFVQIWHPHPRPLLATLLEGCHEDFNLPGTLNTQSWGIERPGSSWLLFSCCLWVCFLFLLSSSLLLSNFTWYQTACLLFPMKQCNFLFSFVSSWLYYCSFFPSRYKKMGHSWLSGECCSPFYLMCCVITLFLIWLFFKGVILSFYINVTGDSLSFLTVSSIGFAIALHIPFIGFLKFLLWVVFVDCIGVGLVIASLLW